MNNILCTLCGEDIELGGGRYEMTDACRACMDHQDSDEYLAEVLAERRAKMEAYLANMREERQGEERSDSMSTESRGRELSRLSHARKDPKFTCCMIDDEGNRRHRLIYDPSVRHPRLYEPREVAEWYAEAIHGEQNFKSGFRMKDGDFDGESMLVEVEKEGEKAVRYRVECEVRRVYTASEQDEVTKDESDS